MKLISFQSHNVAEIILTDGVYKSDPRLCREKHSYEEDARRLGGNMPIWGFGRKETQTEQQFWESVFDQQFWINAKCEMSLKSFEDLARFAVLELEIPNKSVRHGLTHNSYSGAWVFPEIRLEYLHAIYALSYAFNDFVPVIIPVRIFNDCLFDKPMPIGKANKLWNNCSKCSEFASNYF